jgi:hypothetical protein
MSAIDLLVHGAGIVLGETLINYPFRVNSSGEASSVALQFDPTRSLRWEESSAKVGTQWKASRRWLWMLVKRVEQLV